MEKHLDTLDIDYPHIVMSFCQHGSAVQSNLFELILNFLNRWGQMYEEGMVCPDQKLYNVCLLSHKMTSALGR